MRSTECHSVLFIYSIHYAKKAAHIIQKCKTQYRTLCRGICTAKSQPIWIKFCSHLMFYGIHLWADLDRHRRIGGSRPNQNDCFFVILVTHTKSHIETVSGQNATGQNAPDKMPPTVEFVFFSSNAVPVCLHLMYLT